MSRKIINHSNSGHPVIEETVLERQIKQKLIQFPKQDYLTQLILRHVPAALAMKALLGEEPKSKLHIGQKVYAVYSSVRHWEMDQDIMRQKGLLYQNKYVEVAIIGFDSTESYPYKVYFEGYSSSNKLISQETRIDGLSLFSQGANDWPDDPSLDIMKLKDFEY